jgi:WD40 repeat protein
MLVFDSEGGNEWRIVGVSEGGEQISLWSMTRSRNEPGKGTKQSIPASLQIGQLLGTKKLSPTSRVSAVASSSAFYTSKPSFSLITGSTDGAISLWKLDPIDDSPMQEIASFKLHDEQISALQPGPFGTLASSTVSANNIYLWQFEISGPKQSQIRISLKHIIPLTSPNLQYDWLSLYDGDCVLVVADGPQLDVFIQKPKAELRSFGPALERYELSKLTIPIQSIGWSQDGTLVASGLTQGFVFTKWLKSGSAFPTLFHAFSDLHVPLPFYHPRILVELLIEGNFEQVGVTLKHLFTYLDAIPEDTSRVEAVPAMAYESLQTQNSTAKTDSNKDAYSFLDSSTASSISLDAEEQENKAQAFTTANSKRLAEILTRVTLPRVTGKEQMYLLAVIDTFSQMQETQGAIDQCGMKFLLAYKMYSFLRRSLPPTERPSALTSTDFIWALHSEAEDALLQICFPSDGNWSTARSLGIGYWLRKPTTLKALVEKIAKAQFTATKDPHDCFLFYLALNKKPALVALFKAVKNVPVHDFLRNDFNLDKWKTAAMKNAYVLLGKQKFELAAAFFLLGGQLKDCVDVCIKKLGDYQLALLVARLVEGDNGPRPIFDYILTSHILPFAQQNKDHSLASISMWLLKKYSESVSALLPDDQPSETNSVQQLASIPDPALLHVFKFLRSHTMLRDSTLKFDDIHFDLVKKTAITYADSGYGILAVEQLQWLLDTIAERKKKAASSRPSGFSRKFMFDDVPAVVQQDTTSVDPTYFFRVALQLLSQVIL